MVAVCLMIESITYIRIDIPIVERQKSTDNRIWSLKSADRTSQKYVKKASEKSEGEIG